MTTVFSKFDEGRSTEVRVTNDITWTELADAFQEFLSGCGFVVTRADLAEYFSDGEWVCQHDEADTSTDTITITGWHGDTDISVTYGSDVFNTMAADLTSGDKR